MHFIIWLSFSLHAQKKVDIIIRLVRSQIGNYTPHYLLEQCMFQSTIEKNYRQKLDKLFETGAC